MRQSPTQLAVRWQHLKNIATSILSARRRPQPIQYRSTKACCKSRSMTPRVCVSVKLVTYNRAVTQLYIGQYPPRTPPRCHVVTGLDEACVFRSSHQITLLARLDLRQILQSRSAEPSVSSHLRPVSPSTRGIPTPMYLLHSVPRVLLCACVCCVSHELTAL